MSLCYRKHFMCFCNKHAQSTNLGPKLIFGVVSCNFVVARDPLRKWVSWCTQGMSLCYRKHFMCFCNEHDQPNKLGAKRMLGMVSRHLVAERDPLGKRVSGCIEGTSLCYRNHFMCFRNENAQSTNLGSKLMFGEVSCHFVLHVTHSKNGYRGG